MNICVSISGQRDCDIYRFTSFWNQDLDNYKSSVYERGLDGTDRFMLGSFNQSRWIPLDQADGIVLKIFQQVKWEQNVKAFFLSPSVQILGCIALGVATVFIPWAVTALVIARIVIAAIFFSIVARFQEFTDVSNACSKKATEAAQYIRALKNPATEESIAFLQNKRFQFSLGSEMRAPSSFRERVV